MNYNWKVHLYPCLQKQSFPLLLSHSPLSLLVKTMHITVLLLKDKVE